VDSSANSTRKGQYVSGKMSGVGYLRSPSSETLGQMLEFVLSGVVGRESRGLERYEGDWLRGQREGVRPLGVMDSGTDTQVGGRMERERVLGRRSRSLLRRKNISASLSPTTGRVLAFFHSPPVSTEVISRQAYSQA
jgi:hypothetical protein